MENPSNTRVACRREVHWLLTVAVAVGSAVGVRADEPAPAGPTKYTVSLHEAIDIGLRQQPTVEAARIMVEAAKHQLQVANSPLAVLGGPEIPVRRKQAELGVNVAQANLDEAELSTINAVSRTYLSVLFAKAQLRVAEEAYGHLKDAYDFAKTGVEKKILTQTTQTDVDRLKIYVDIASTRRTVAQAGVGRALAALREAMGLGCDCCVEVVGEGLEYEAVKVDCCCAVTNAVRHRPELVQAVLFAQITELEIDAQGRMMITGSAPTFAATADIHARPIPTGTNDGDYRPGPLGPDMPTTLAGMRGARQERARYFYQRALAAAGKLKGLIVLEVEDACLRLEENAAQILLLRDSVKNAAKIAEDLRVKYRNDVTGPELMLGARVLEAQVKVQLNEALFRHATGLAGLYRMTGGHLKACLSPAAEPIKAPEPKPPEPPKPEE